MPQRKKPKMSEATQSNPDQGQGIIQPATATPSNETPAPEPKLTGLEYLGGQAIIGVPARDLAVSELDGLLLSLEELVQTGLYWPSYETEV